jgi:hypothetical protein
MEKIDMARKRRSSYLGGDMVITQKTDEFEIDESVDLSEEEDQISKFFSIDEMKQYEHDTIFKMNFGTTTAVPENFLQRPKQGLSSVPSSKLKKSKSLRRKSTQTIDISATINLKFTNFVGENSLFERAFSACRPKTYFPTLKRPDKATLKKYMSK